MSKDKLDSFKVGDAHREGMSKPADTAKKGEEIAPESFSLGFARIEAMLEKEDPGEVGESLSKILSDLQELQDAAKTNKDKLATQKAIAAVERTADLMDYLFQTKAAMEANVGK